MPDRVDEHAAELVTEAARIKAEKDASDARCRAALSDLQNTLVATLAGHTRYKVKPHIDPKEWSLHISYAKRQFEKTIERQILEVRLNRFELDRGAARVFQLRVPFDAVADVGVTPGRRHRRRGCPKEDGRDHSGIHGQKRGQWMHDHGSRLKLGEHLWADDAEEEAAREPPEETRQYSVVRS